MSKVKYSALQKQQQGKIIEANAYASAMRRDAKLRKKYEKKLKPGESVYHKAKKEFFEKVMKEK